MRTNLFIFLVNLTIILTSCSMFQKERKVSGTKGNVIAVIDGKTIKLQNGLTVELLGINPSDLGKKYMEEHIIGKQVTLIADKQDPRQTYKTASTKVRAYVKLMGESGSLNGKLLTERWANGVNINGPASGILTLNTASSIAPNASYPISLTVDGIVIDFKTDISVNA